MIYPPSSSYYNTFGSDSGEELLRRKTDGDKILVDGRQFHDDHRTLDAINKDARQYKSDPTV